ncbi:MAG: hypothetical protein M3162_02825 [Thermoproteota archaeon]|nr:hypothetical protein [Thermoproteota archaeon]
MNKIFAICLLIFATIVLISNSLVVISYALQDKSFSIKILSPSKAQKFDVFDKIIIKGISNYNKDNDCAVSIILNNKKPYQEAIPIGNNNGSTDFSKWEFTINKDSDKFVLVDGVNKVTAKNYCNRTNSAVYYSTTFNTSEPRTNAAVGDRAETILPQKALTSNVSEPRTNAAVGDTAETILPQKALTSKLIKPSFYPCCEIKTIEDKKELANSSLLGKLDDSTPIKKAGSIENKNHDINISKIIQENIHKLSSISYEDDRKSQESIGNHESRVLNDNDDENVNDNNNHANEEIQDIKEMIARIMN